MSVRLVPMPGAAAALVGIATALPASSVDNGSLLARVAPALQGPRRDAMLAALESQLGTVSRHHLDPSNSDEGRAALVRLSKRAALDALARAAIDPRSISFHIHATSTPSRWTTPESARIGRALHEEAGLDAPFMDVRMGCTGGLQALYQGFNLAASLQAPILVTAADRFSHVAPPSERFAPFVFGDGASAAVLVPSGAAPAGSLVLSEACFLGAARHADLATVPAELPPRADDEAPWHLSGDAEAFDAAAREALTALAAHFQVSSSSSPAIPVIVSTTRPVAARALAGAAAFTEALEQRGHLGAASALSSLDALLAAHGTPRQVILLGSGGGLAAGGLRLVRRDARPEAPR